MCRFNGTVVVFPQGLEQSVAVLFLTHYIGPGTRQNLIAQQFLQQFRGKVLVAHVADVFKKFIRQQPDIRFIEARQFEYIRHAVGDDGIVQDLFECGSLVLVAALLVNRCVLGNNRLDGRYERDLFAQRLCLVERAAQ